MITELRHVARMDLGKKFQEKWPVESLRVVDSKAKHLFLMGMFRSLGHLCHCDQMPGRNNEMGDLTPGFRVFVPSPWKRQGGTQ